MTLVDGLKQLIPNGAFHNGYDVLIQDGEYQMIVGRLDPNNPKRVVNQDYKANSYTTVVAHLAGQDPGPLIITGPLAVL